MGPADMDEPGPGDGDAPADDGHDDGGEVTGTADSTPDDASTPGDRAPDDGRAAEAAALGGTPADGTPPPGEAATGGPAAAGTAPARAAEGSTAAPGDAPDTIPAGAAAAASGQPPGDEPGGSQAGDQVPLPPASRRPGRKKKILAWTAGRRRGRGAGRPGRRLRRLPAPERQPAPGQHLRRTRHPAGGHPSAGREHHDHRLGHPARPGPGLWPGAHHGPVRHADDHAHRGRPEVGQRDVDPA